MTAGVILNSDFASAISENVPSLVMDLESGEILYASRELEDMFKIQMRGELIGQVIEILLPERLRPKHKLHRQQYLKNPVPRAMGGNLPLIGLRRTGQEFALEVGLWPVVICGRKCVVAIALDMSGRQISRAHA